MDNKVKDIKFKCNSGKESDRYGFFDSTQEFVINLSGTPLDTITGRAGWSLDQIGGHGGTGGDEFIYKCENDLKIRGVAGSRTKHGVNSIGFKCA